MNEKPIDFTILDPSRNVQRWNARIELITSRAIASRRRRLTVEGQLLLWARPMLAMAASVAFVGWLGFALAGSPTVVTSSADPALAITTWAARDEVPNTETVMMAFGGSIVKE
jgi:hypothetical protein